MTWWRAMTRRSTACPSTCRTCLSRARAAGSCSAWAASCASAWRDTSGPGGATAGRAVATPAGSATTRATASVARTRRRGSVSDREHPRPGPWGRRRQPPARRQVARSADAACAEERGQPPSLGSFGAAVAAGIVAGAGDQPGGGGGGGGGGTAPHGGRRQEGPHAAGGGPPVMGGPQPGGGAPHPAGGGAPHPAGGGAPHPGTGCHCGAPGWAGKPPSGAPPPTFCASNHRSKPSLRHAEVEVDRHRERGGERRDEHRGDERDHPGDQVEDHHVAVRREQHRHQQAGERTGDGRTDEVAHAQRGEHVPATPANQARLLRSAARPLRPSTSSAGMEANRNVHGTAYPTMQKSRPTNSHSSTRRLTSTIEPRRPNAKRSDSRHPTSSPR